LSILVLVISAFTLVGCSNSNIGGGAYIQDLSPVCEKWSDDCDAGNSNACKNLEKCYDVPTRSEVKSMIEDGGLEEDSKYMTREEVLDMLNTCQTVHSEGYRADISCNQLCAEQGLTCVKQDYAYFTEEVGWAFDPGFTCGSSIPEVNNTHEVGGSKIHCICC
jgi:hypothetical protein